MANPERYETFLRSALAFGSAGSVAEALDILSGALLRTIDFDTVTLLLSRGAEHAWYRLSRDTDHPQFTAHRETPPSENLAQGGAKSVCTVPLATPRGSLGSLTFGSNQADAYPEEEVRFLTLVGAQAGLVLLSLMDQSFTDQAGVPGVDRLKVILEINNNIATNLDLYDLLRSVSASVRNALRGDAAGISIPEGEHLRLYTLDFPGALGAAREGLLIPIQGSMLGDVF